jgi:hypothetical protein
MSYGDLTEAEQAHWNEYTNLRGISDWPGFDPDQDQRRQASRDWLVNRRKEIWRSAQPKSEGGDGQGWNHAQRQERWDFLQDDNLNTGAPKHEVTLPCPGSATDLEMVYVEEREVYLAFGSTTDAQKARKQSNVDWLVGRRQDVWRLIDDSSDQENAENDRHARYDALCIATHYGDAYTNWDKTHNKWGQKEGDTGGTGGRSACKDWLTKYLGTNEDPPSSNRGREQPSTWQERVYGDDGVPWCACFAGCSAWDNGVSGSVTAGVWNNTELARKGQGIYKGYTTDPAKVHAGDHAFIASDHTGVIYDRASMVTIEGNTSPGSEGSQYNGGTVAKRDRGGGYWTGYGLVRFPD